MAGLFIDVEVAPSAASDAAIVAKLVEVCPVDIFEASDAGVQVVEMNLDECTLCDLCIQAAPDGKIRVVKLYDQE